MIAAVSNEAGWQGDVLNRKPLGDFLYRLATQRYEVYHSKPGDGALSFALDADWGAGKSFFVRRWSEDIAAKGHPIVYFDAWANDLADDPLLGFMAQLQASITPWLKQLPVARKVKDAASSKLKHVLKQAPRAVMPVVSLVAKGVLKKAAALDTDELIEAVTSGDAEGLSIGGVKEMSLEGIEKFFQIALKSHSDKQSAIAGLKRSIEDLLRYLYDHAGIRLPLFVFIDELDRCRPDYAIRLLEGIKHLFDAQGVCFVCSTNLVQLSASAQAVYGSSFDGYRYLKRFFAFDYRLPEPDHAAYALLLANESVLARRELKFRSARPGASTEPIEVLAGDFALVASSLGLDLRSQKQVFRLAEAAAAGLDDGSSLYCLYLFFLAGVYQRGAVHFDSLSAKFPETVNGLIRRDATVKYRAPDERGRQASKTTKVNALVTLYHSLAGTQAGKLLDTLPERESDYPDSLRWIVFHDEVNGKALPPRDRLSLSRYYGLVRTGGQVLAAEPVAT